MLTALDRELLAEDARRIAGEDAAEQQRLEAVLNAERQMRERQEAEARAEEERASWRAITGSCAYLDSLPDDRKDLLIRAFQRAAAARPEHSYHFLRAMNMVRPVVLELQAQWQAEAAARAGQGREQSALAVIDPALEQAARDRDLAIDNMYQRTRAWYSLRAPKAPCCFTKSVKQGRATAAGYQILAKRVPCRNSHCAHCFRERKAATLKSGNRAILDFEPGGNRQRVDTLTAAIILPSRLQAVEKAIHRAGGKDIGYIHFADDRHRPRVLVWATVPFAGSEETKPAELAARFSSCAETMSKQQHAFRLLGSWKHFIVKKAKAWDFLGATSRPVNWASAVQELRAQGVDPVTLSGKHGQGVLFGAVSKADAEAIWNACPSFSSWGGEGLKKRNSDTAPVTVPAEWYEPSQEPFPPWNSG
jgi:hypothetical protein